MKRLTAAFALFPTLALAHPGDHGHAEWLHLLTEPDHAAMIALSVAALAYAVFKLRARR